MIDASSGVLVGEGLRADGVLIHAPAPLGNLWVPMSRGLTVLYGRNGAGKTHVLRALSCAFRGIALPSGHVSVHISPVDDRGYFDHSLLAKFEETIYDFDDADSTHEYLEELDLEDEERVDERLNEVVSRLIERLREEAEKYGLADGLCHTPRLALVATGTAVRPCWETFVSVVPSELVAFADSLGYPPEAWDRLASRALGAGNIGLPSSLAPHRVGGGWQDAGLPVLASSLRVRSDDLADGEPNELSAQGLIACLVGTDRSDIEAETLRSIRAELAEGGEPSLLEWADSESLQPSTAVRERLDALSGNATLALQRLTGSASKLSATLMPPDSWLDGEVIRWSGTDPYGVELPIASLGAGSARWAGLAVSLALTKADWSRPVTIMMDEPERALHSAAQQGVAEAFAATLRDQELGLMDVVGAVVATHSPAFLSLPDVNLVHVSRGTAGCVALDAIDTTIGVEGLTAQLGISRADVLLTARWFIYVEGEHDRAVLQAVFGDEFRRKHAHLRTMDGASNVQAYITAQDLLTYSDARIRVVLDRIGAAAGEWWAASQEAAEEGDRSRARRTLEKLNGIRGNEAKWLFEAGVAALERGQIHRIEIVGLDRPDIINYLPAEAIVPGAVGWKDLANEFFGQRRSGSFKQWLRSDKGATFDAATLGEIAARIEVVGDLERVIAGL